MVFEIKCTSPYVEKIDKGIRTFEVEAEDYNDALYWANQSMVAGKESIISVEQERYD